MDCDIEGDVYSRSVKQSTVEVSVTSQRGVKVREPTVSGIFQKRGGGGRCQSKRTYSRSVLAPLRGKGREGCLQYKCPATPRGWVAPLREGREGCQSKSVYSRSI